MPVLTVASVAKYTAQAKRREIPDTRATGLYLIIQPKPSGAKSWALRFRRPKGRPAKMTLGSVELTDRETKDDPVIGGALTLRQARELAAQIDRKRANGIDVIEEHKAKRLRQRADEEEREANVFGTCLRQFFVKYKTKKWKTRPRRWRDDASLLGLRWPPGSDPAITEPEVIKGGLADIWRDKPVASLDGHDVHAVVKEAERDSDGRARKLHTAISVFFTWLKQDRLIASNPAHGGYRPGPPLPGERVLSDAEIVHFWHGCDTIGAPYSQLFRLLLLTGCRLREVANMTRAEIDANGVWVIPGSRTKNHRPHPLSLPPLAQKIIASLPEIVGEAGYVFTTNGRTPVSGFSVAKKRLDAAMAESAGHPVAAWKTHDLRRTCASGMAALGIALPVAEKVLNHVSGSFGGIVGVYQKYDYSTEKAEALQRWAAHVQGLVDDRANVVTMKKAKR